MMSSAPRSMPKKSWKNAEERDYAQLRANITAEGERRTFFYRRGGRISITVGSGDCAPRDVFGHQYADRPVETTKPSGESDGTVENSEDNTRGEVAL